MQTKRVLICAILVILFALCARALPGPRTIDDAYITFRYARNLIEGHGMVYNPGERVLGTTTPLYTLLLAGSGLLWGGSQAPFPVIALIINAISDALVCILLILLAKQLGFPRAGISAALIWAIAPMSVSFAIGGMETSFFIALMLATLYMELTDRPVMGAALASLSMLTRPDALLFLLPLAAERMRRTLPQGRFNPHPFPITLKEAAALIIPYGIWAAAAIPFYGSPLPRSMAAKVVAYQLPPEAATIRLLQHYATPFLGHLTFGIPWIGIGLVLFILLFGLGALLIMRKNITAWPIVAYPVVYFAAFSIANPLIFRWYLAPPLPLYFLGIFFGVERLARDLRSPIPAYVLAVLAFGLTLRGWVLHPSHGPDRPAPDMAYIRLELFYQDAAQLLLDELAPGDVIAAGDIGALGYYTDAHILDTVGLISSKSQEYYPAPEELYVINYAIPPALILDQKPDFLVILEVYGRRGLLRDPDFAASYALIGELDADLYGSEGMLIYQRVASP